MNRDVLRQRVLSRIVIDTSGPCTVDDAPCWNWSRGTEGHGYGRFRLRNLTYLAHRAAWELLRGPIPPLHQVDHLCPNPACCNPAHLELSPGRLARLETAGQQAARRLARSRRRTSRCAAGHLYTDANTYLRPNGSRRCRTCDAASRRRLRAAR